MRISSTPCILSKNINIPFFFLLLLFLSHLEIYVIFVIDVVYVARSLREEWIFYA